MLFLLLHCLCWYDTALSSALTCRHNRDTVASPSDQRLRNYLVKPCAQARCHNIRGHSSVTGISTFQSYRKRCILLYIAAILPTCKTLIRKHVYSFMTSVMNSCNVNLHSIVRSDRVFCLPCGSIGEDYCTCTRFSFLFLVSLWLHIMNVIYPQ